MPKKPSEDFRTVRKQKTTSSEDFGTLPNLSEKTPEHTLSVREVAKMFEKSGVSRTERSILSWCWPNKQGIAKLNCYFDPAERKWYITPSSMDMAIKEEQNRLKNKAQMPASQGQQKASEDLGTPSEGFGTYQEHFGTLPNAAEKDSPDILEKRLSEFERKNRDLEISNRVKDVYIERLETNQQNFIEQLTDKSHRIGELETELRLLQSPDKNRLKGTLDVEPESKKEMKKAADDKKPVDDDKEASTSKNDDALTPEPTEEKEN